MHNSPHPHKTRRPVLDKIPQSQTILAKLPFSYLLEGSTLNTTENGILYQRGLRIVQLLDLSSQLVGYGRLQISLLPVGGEFLYETALFIGRLCILILCC